MILALTTGPQPGRQTKKTLRESIAPDYRVAIDSLIKSPNPYKIENLWMFLPTRLRPVHLSRPQIIPRCINWQVFSYENDLEILETLYEQGIEEPVCLLFPGMLNPGIDLADFLTFAQLARKADVVLGVTAKEGASSSCSLLLDERDSIIKISPQPAVYQWKPAGIYYFTPPAILLLARIPSIHQLHFEDFLRILHHEGYAFSAYPINEIKTEEKLPLKLK
ncbi:MAG: hypothetical protein LWX56_06840 [Ignavibacteria bacterium]|nr:hypothetical protein [Ignavibacteria bacterium]